MKRQEAWTCLDGSRKLVIRSQKLMLLPHNYNNYYYQYYYEYSFYFDDDDTQNEHTLLKQRVIHSFTLDSLSSRPQPGR